MVYKDRIDIQSILTKVKIFRENCNYHFGKYMYALPQKEISKVMNIIEKIENGFKVNAYDDTLDGPSGIKMEEDVPVDNIGKRKRKNESVKSPKNVKKSSKKANDYVSKSKKRKIVKPPKVKIDRKLNPNWKLKPNPDIKVWEKDPFLETNEEIPFVSSVAHSKLTLRAVNLNNMKLLKSFVDDVNQVHNPNVEFSLGNKITPIKIALKNENIQAINILTTPTKIKKARVEKPTCTLSTSDTGKYNYRSLGIKKIRALKMSRGGREGNNAFTKDQHVDLFDNSVSARDVMEWNLSVKFIDELIKNKKISINDIVDHSIYKAVR